MDYLASDAFDPQTELSADDIRSLFREPTPAERLGARVRGATSSEQGHAPELAMDGDPATIWHSS